MTNRKQRAKTAHETIAVLDQGYYETDNGDRVNIETELKYAVENTELYRPDDFENIQLDGKNSGPFSVEVKKVKTLKAAHKLSPSDRSDPFVLNFASARNPGGGFLNGSESQEESLARATGLYACISEVTEYYQKNRQSGTGLYTDNMIYSPEVPVIRGENGDFLDSPFFVSILTAPAVNRKDVAKKEPESLPEVESTMDSRIRKVLKVAADNAHKILILGAWGCGVFGNDPKMISKLFRKNLKDVNTFENEFEKVLFAISGNTSPESNYDVFSKVLEG